MTIDGQLLDNLIGYIKINTPKTYNMQWDHQMDMTLKA
jgi:hypothetical protein